jgi:ankyrin repeat protein
MSVVGPYPAFEDAAMKGDLVKMKELRSQYPEFNLDRPLILAAQEGRLEMIKYLVKEGGNPRAQADQALIRAATEGHLDVVAYLLSLGADANAGDGLPLINAARYGRLDVLKLLCQHTSASVE